MNLKQKPDLSRIQLFNLSFGFLGVQIAYALQSGNNSRIFATIGADPHSLSYFWILPPLMGLIVQPLVGIASDNTWNRFGRRIPYLIFGALISIIMMVMLPNTGSFSDTTMIAMVIGAVILMFLDTSLNMAMQPFKMMVGDMVNEKQKGLAYAIQSFLVNLGQVIGFALPFILTYIGLSNNAENGVPQSVKWAFYIGAVILIACVFYTISKVKEMPPKEFAQYQEPASENKGEKIGVIKLIRTAPSNFWRVSLVQFFCWVTFLLMWTYTTGTISDTVWNSTDTTSKAYQEAGDWVGIIFAVEAMASVLWAAILPTLENKFGLKFAYALSLIVGGVGFCMVPFIHNQWMLFLPFALIGCAWAAMLAMPFTIVTNALEGRSHMGTYLGLFNASITIPQILAGLTGGIVLTLVGGLQSNMMLVAGISLIIGALCVFFIRKHTNKV